MKTRKLFSRLEKMPLNETKFTVNIVFNDAMIKMRSKIDASKAKGVDVADNEEIMSDLAICWSVVNSVYEVNEELYRRVTIANGRLAVITERYEDTKRENEEIKERCAEAWGDSQKDKGKG